MGQVDTLITSGETLATSQPRLTEMQRLAKLHAKPCRNASGGAINVYTGVRISGYDSGSDLPTMVTCSAVDQHRLLGIVVAEDGGSETTVANNQTGFVMDQGFVQGLNTSGFAANDLLWLHASTPGSFQNTPVDGQNPVGFVVTASAAPNGVIYFRAAGILPAGTIGAVVAAGGTQSFTVHLGTVSASGNFFIAVNRGRWKITNVRLMVATTTVSNATDHWTIQVANRTAANNLRSASFDTNGNDLTQFVPKDLGLNQNQTITTDLSCIELQLTKLASAPNLVQLSVTLEYQPV